MKDEMGRAVRIGCFGGFWGDSMALAVGQFLRSPVSDSIDFLVSDYLAEVTMCILAKKKSRPTHSMGQGGFVEDFATVIWKNFGQVLLQKKIRVVVNAGGMNPLGLKALLEQISATFERQPVVAAVTGDDLLPWGRDRLAQVLQPFTVDGAPEIRDAPAVPATAAAAADGAEPPPPLLSCSAYLGAGPIAAALRAGADVVVTGRCVDSAMVLGPLIAEFGWSGAMYDQLAAGTVAGHVIECGAQCTGGNFTDWEIGLHRGVSAGRYFENPGFPLVDVAPDGTFTVFKPPRTAGVVSPLSVAEQLVYEIGDPAAYIVPDVQCDLRGVSVALVGEGEGARVWVSGVRGRAPTGRLKVTATSPHGHLATLSFVYVGTGAYYKAKAVAATVVRRARKQLIQLHIPPFEDVRVEYFGAGVSHYAPAIAALMAKDAREVVVRISAHHATNPRAFAVLAAQIPSASTGMAPGLFSLSNARIAPSEAVALRSATVAAADVVAHVHVGAAAPVAVPTALPPTPSPSVLAVATTTTTTTTSAATSTAAAAASPSALTTAPLITIACCRSGDKGDAVNIGVVARRREYFSALVAQVTPERVRRHCAAWFDGNSDGNGVVRRFELPGLPALNFVLGRVLGGGGLISLKGDKQGKSLGSILLELPVEVPVEWVRAYEVGVGHAKALARAHL